MSAVNGARHNSSPRVIKAAAIRVFVAHPIPPRGAVPNEVMEASGNAINAALRNMGVEVGAPVVWEYNEGFGDHINATDDGHRILTFRRSLRDGESTNEADHDIICLENAGYNSSTRQIVFGDVRIRTMTSYAGERVRFAREDIGAAMQLLEEEAANLRAEIAAAEEAEEV
jgi:hypothetical protein